MNIVKFLILAFVAFAALPAHAGERTISVDGMGTAAAKPDRAEIHVAVIANTATAGEAMAAVSTKAAGVLKSLSAHGIAEADIQTGSVSLTPVYQRQQNTTEQRPKVVGYRAAIDNRVQVRKPDSLGKILDGLSKAGADGLGNIRFFVADTDTLRTEARGKAVKNAFAIAEQLSAAAGVKLGDVISIVEGDGGGPGPQQREMVFASAQRGVPVMPGDVSVQVRVHMVFAIK